VLSWHSKQAFKAAGQNSSKAGPEDTLVSSWQGRQSQLLLNGTWEARSSELQCQIDDNGVQVALWHFHANPSYFLNLTGWPRGAI